MTDLNVVFPDSNVLSMMDLITNDNSMDFFDNDSKFKEIHIRVYQRKSRKYITTIEGMDSDLNFKKIIKCMKKTFSCNGTIKMDPKNERLKIIQLAGDQRDDVKDFLLRNELASIEQIKIHGF